MDGVEFAEDGPGRPLMDDGPFGSGVGTGLDGVAVRPREGLHRVGVRRRGPADLHLARRGIADLDRGPRHHRNALVDLGASFRPHLAAGPVRHHRHDAVAIGRPIAEGLRVEVGVVSQTLHGGHQGVARAGRHADPAGRLQDVPTADAAVDLIATQGLHRLGILVGAGVDDPVDLHRVADGLGRRGDHRPRQNPNLHRLHIRQGHGVRIRGLEHHLIRGLADRITAGGPAERAHVRQRVPSESGVGLEVLEGAADGGDRDVVPVGVGRRDREGQRLALQDAGVGRNHHDGRLVGTRLHVDLHVPDDLADHEPLATHPAPLADAEGHVVFARQGGRIPHHGAREGFHVEFPAGALHLVGLDEPLDGQAFKAGARHQVVTERVPVGVEGARVVLPALADARVLDGWGEQDGAVVLPRLGVDDEQARDAEGHVHRARDVEDAVVSVGVLDDEGVDARAGVGVDPFINVEPDLAADELPGGNAGRVERTVDAGQTVHRRGAPLVPPAKREPGPVGHHARLGVGGDGHLIGRALQVLVGDLPRPVVRGRGRRADEQGEKQQEGLRTHGHRKVNVRLRPKVTSRVKNPLRPGGDAGASGRAPELPSHHVEEEAHPRRTVLGRPPRNRVRVHPQGLCG